MYLQKRHADQIIDQARSESPNECCGIMAGTGDAVIRLFPATNSEASPKRYSLNPAELFRIMKEVERAGLDLVGFYHSHTHTEAYPSPTDREMAFWPECRYAIISLQDAHHPVIRAFRIEDGNVTEEKVVINGGRQDP